MKWWASHLTHLGRLIHICTSKPIIIGSDNGLLPGWRQAIIETSAGISLIGPLGTNSIEIWINIHTFSFRKMHLKMASAKWQPFCLGFNMLINVKNGNYTIWSPMVLSVYKDTCDGVYFYIYYILAVQDNGIVVFSRFISRHDICWFCEVVTIGSGGVLTHCGPVMPHGIIELGQHWFR